LLDISSIEKFDPQGMYKVYDMWPQIARESYELDLEPIDFKEIDHVVFCGMGGSGTIGDLFSAILSKTDIHVKVVKGYILPKTVDENTLVVTTSISGNTVETMTNLSSANKLNCKKIAFSSGGTMESFCSKNGIEYRKIKQHHSPRSSFVGYVYSILKVLNSIFPIQKSDIIESIKELESTSKQINSNNLTEKNPSLSLANWILGIPLIYYPLGLQAAAIRFKNSLQENAKCHAFGEDVIEASHNDIVSWERQSIVQPILIQGEDDFVKTKERWKILKEYFDTNKIDFWEVNSVKGSILSKLTNLIYLLDYCSIYLAMINQIDPTPVKSLDFIKKRL